jgi:hypothetical protein
VLPARTTTVATAELIAIAGPRLGVWHSHVCRTFVETPISRNSGGDGHVAHAALAPLEPAGRGSHLGASSAEARMRMELRKSVLDSVLPQQASLQSRLNAEDRAKVDQLFTGIRELEESLQGAGSGAAECMSPTEPAASTNVPTIIDQMNALMAGCAYRS